jgi:hypothetical protein
MVEFDDLVRREAAGELLIGVDRPFARRFYTDVSLREVEARTGEAPYFEKMIVYFAFVGGPLVLLASLAQSVWLLGWWSVLFIPIAVVVWVGVYGDSARAGARMTFISLLVVACAIGFAISPGSSRPGWGLAFTYSAGLWLARLLYVSATSFLRGFVLRNRRAWEWLQEHMVIREGGGIAG